ncbi:MAG: hypothetical protein GTO29_11960 [Candidatus Latescibacteria bacterium]|nr:hypothetical protein [Candidatus Latescibacterota bacterium]NIO56879.1 hypothetical protein [Candidatus Latescibacterota bacterium]
MKWALTITLCLMLPADSASAQPGAIGLSSELNRVDCEIYDEVPGLINFYVLHVFSAGATSSQFMVKIHPGVVLTWLADTITEPFISIGNSQTDIAITYGSCLVSPIHILTITYLAFGLSEECSYLEVIASPAAVLPEVLVTDCSNPPKLYTSTGGAIVVNPNAICWCNFHEPDPVGLTTWGQIKKLYR